MRHYAKPISGERIIVMPIEFTKKQLYILELLFQGYTNQVIVEKFSKKFRTNCGMSNIEHHIKAIYHKIQIPDQYNQRVYAANYYREYINNEVLAVSG
jgi:DNA-binding NarL/FixJ family response regulator